MPLATLLCALVAAAALAAPAPAAGLAGAAGRCPGADDPRAHHRTQRLAMHCLVRLARRVASRPPVRSSVVLRHSATRKARRIAECRTFTHFPCGDPLGAEMRRTELERRRWLLGENLAWGAPGKRATALSALRAWLRSEPHLDVLLDRRLDRMGVRRRRLALTGAPRGSVLWILHMGRRLP